MDHCTKVNRGQTREICEKQEKNLKGKVATFTVKCLILYQYPVDLLTFLELYLKNVLKWANWDLLTPFDKAICAVAENLKLKKPVYVREIRMHLHSTPIVYTLAHVSTS